MVIFTFYVLLSFFSFIFFIGCKIRVWFPVTQWDKETQQLCSKCPHMSLLGYFFVSALDSNTSVLFLPQTWSIQSATSDRNRPDQTRSIPVTDPSPPLPPPALKAASTSTRRSSCLPVIYFADRTTSHHHHWDRTGGPEVPPAGPLSCAWRCLR